MSKKNYKRAGKAYKDLEHLKCVQHYCHYSRAKGSKGTADHYWPQALFFFILKLTLGRG